MLTGSCLCGKTAYAAEAEIGAIGHCHCESCRKAHGAAFSSIASVPRKSFSWTRGGDLLKAFESSPGKLRWFCSNCGSQLMAERAQRSSLMLRLGCLDTPVPGGRQTHIWRSDGASWYDPNAEFDELPEGAPVAVR